MLYSRDAFGTRMKVSLVCRFEILCNGLSCDIFEFKNRFEGSGCSDMYKNSIWEKHLFRTFSLFRPIFRPAGPYSTPSAQIGPYPSHRPISGLIGPYRPVSGPIRHSVSCDSGQFSMLVETPGQLQTSENDTKIKGPAAEPPPIKGKKRQMIRN